jgi:hypothetical protein
LLTLKAFHAIREGARMSMRAPVHLLTIACALCACGPDEEAAPEGQITAELSAGLRRARAEAIREVAAQRGLVNAALLAGIADAETGLAHCWSEAQWACMGPDSDSCGGPATGLAPGAKAAWGCSSSTAATSSRRWRATGGTFSRWKGTSIMRSTS